MNRFTNDQNVLDLDIYWSVSAMYIQMFSLIGNTFLNVYASTYYIIIPVVFLFCFTLWLYRIYMSANRELYRLESISKSPILSYFSETIIGVAVIRAYNRTMHCLQMHINNLDRNRKITLALNNTSSWFSLLLTFASYSVNISAIIFCIFYSNNNPAFAGLLMTYASTINDNI